MYKCRKKHWRTQTFYFETTNEEYIITETYNRWEIYGASVGFSKILWSPFPLIYGLTDQFKSNVKKQERSSNIWNFPKFHEPVETTGPWLAESCTFRQSKTLSPTVSVPRFWGTTWSSCRYWYQRKNSVENGVLLAPCLIGTVCYRRCQNRLHLNSMGSCTVLGLLVIF